MSASARFSTMRSWARDCLTGWDAFWFTPALPHTLAVIRICAGAMAVYVHVIWLSRATDFFGESAWLDQETIRELHSQDWGWSWLFYVEQPLLIGLHQLLAIAAGLMVMLGVFTRAAVPVAWWLTLMVCHRMTGALFGLDQVLVMLLMYLMIAHSGEVWSWDARRSERASSRGSDAGADAESGPPARISNNLATRLIQLHLCVIYIFGGLSKMRGEQWFEGSALWWTAVNYEYQSLDLTWMGRFPFLIASLTAITIFWETFYCATVWPRLTRPITLLLALFVHGGIALALGMITFGFIMIVANFSFVPPELVRSWVTRHRN